MNKFVSKRQEPIKTIKFSHKYKKMPVVLSPTFLKGVRLKHYNELTEDFIKLDTETVDGKFYQLPKTQLLILDLWSEGTYWHTVRRWTSEKEKYYRSLVGQEVKIVVEEE